MSDSLAQSYAYCRSVARRRARNFYYAFVLLPRPEHDAICAVYAFMRYCDDLSDEPGAARAAIDRWRSELESALAGHYGAHRVWPAFHHVVQRYQIPHQYFRDMIDGVASDLEHRRFRTFDELYRYCYQVASVAGLSVIHIFGFESRDAFALAEKCGVAFQLTNILRDVREDAERGRIYLPAEDLDWFSVKPEDLIEARNTEQFVELMRFQAMRARAYFSESWPLVGMVGRRNRASLRALIGIYERLLDKIERSNFDVLARRISLPPWEKATIVLRAAFRGSRCAR